MIFFVVLRILIFMYSIRVLQSVQSERFFHPYLKIEEESRLTNQKIK